MADVTRPSDTISVKGRTITMTYGLINEITSLGIEINAIGALVVDPSVRNMVLAQVLNPRKDDGTFDTEDGEPKHPDQFGLSVDEALDVIEWIVEHVAHFFMRSMLKAKALHDRYEKEASNLTSGSNGSGTSPSKTPSAGPSTASPVS